MKAKHHTAMYSVAAAFFVLLALSVCTAFAISAESPSVSVIETTAEVMETANDAELTDTYEDTVTTHEGTSYDIETTTEFVPNILDEYVLGDVDMDGALSVYDAYLILEYCSEMREFNANELILADLTGDGQIIAYDAIKLLEIVAGIYAPHNPSVAPYFSKGADVSKYQGNIDWQAAKDDGIEFAILRAGYGQFDDQKDEYFEKNYVACKELGIPVGVYHFSYATSVEGAVAEANTLLKWIDGKQFEYPVYFDIEHYTNLGVKLTTQIVETFCEIMEEHNYYVGVYSYSYYLEHYIDYDVLKWYSVWVADLSDNAVSFTGSYDMWQYSHSGSVTGINSRVDLNYCYKNFPEIMREYNLNGFEKPTEETTEGTEEETDISEETTSTQ